MHSIAPFCTFSHFGFSALLHAAMVRCMSYLLDEHDAADFLGVSVHSIRQWTRDAHIPCVELPNSEHRYIRSELETWLRELQKPTQLKRATA